MVLIPHTLLYISAKHPWQTVPYGNCSTPPLPRELFPTNVRIYVFAGENCCIPVFARFLRIPLPLWLLVCDSAFLFILICCDDIREEWDDSVCRTGGHQLGSAPFYPFFLGGAKICRSSPPDHYLARITAAEALFGIHGVKGYAAGLSPTGTLKRHAINSFAVICA